VRSVFVLNGIQYSLMSACGISTGTCMYFLQGEAFENKCMVEQ
jgi:hypothetical protein